MGLIRVPQLPLRAAIVLRGGAINMQVAGLAGLGASYASTLVQHPILTKSFTSGVIFALSDASAQIISPPSSGERDHRRTLVTALIGFAYFGPVLHWYLDFLTWLAPGTDILSTLLKTLVGQLGFGPALTCLFFGAFLIVESGLRAGLARWPAKIKQDLLVTWTSELCFWPFVDLISFTFVPVTWIPLGYNVANFFWTVFLSLQACKAVDSSERE